MPSNFQWAAFLRGIPNKQQKKANKYVWLVPLRWKLLQPSHWKEGRCTLPLSWAECNKIQYYKRTWCDFPNGFPTITCHLHVLYILEEVGNTHKSFFSASHLVAQASRFCLVLFLAGLLWFIFQCQLPSLIGKTVRSFWLPLPLLLFFQLVQISSTPFHMEMFKHNEIFNASDRKSVV